MSGITRVFKSVSQKKLGLQAHFLGNISTFVLRLEKQNPKLEK
jgi:hypothetical protein